MGKFKTWQPFTTNQYHLPFYINPNILPNNITQMATQPPTSQKKGAGSATFQAAMAATFQAAKTTSSAMAETSNIFFLAAQN